MKCVRLGLSLLAAVAVFIVSLSPGISDRSILMPSAALAAEQSYVVGPEDELAITVWDHPDLGRKTRVNLEGMISFPLIGEVRAAGKSLIQLETDIKAKLANGFIVDPHVTIQITEYRSQKISIIGEVNQPGAYPLTKKTTLVEAIAMAGGVKQEADHEVMIVRPRTGNPKGGALLPNQVDPNDVIKVPIRDVLEGEKTHNIEVINGDTIFVPKIKVFYVTGEAKRPGQYTYLKGMTVLNAISTAGGFTEKASKRKVRIVREKGGKKEELAAALENQIEPGDTIVVPESFW